MSRTRKTISALIIASLALIPISCSGSDSNDAKPDTGTLATPEATSSTSEATTTTAPPTTTTTQPLILNAPVYQTFCNQEYPYCVEFPTDGEALEPRSYEPGVIGDTAYNSVDVFYGSELASGRLCTMWYEDPPECEGFDDVFYGVSARPMPGVSAEDALAAELESYKESMHNINYGTFAGSPAVIGEFGSLGTYIAFFHNGVLYQIAANGQEGRPYGEQRFRESFRFTDMSEEYEA